MTNLFKKLVFTDKAIDDLTVAVQAGKSITVERAVLSGWTPPDDDQVYTPYKNSSGALDVAAVKANINKYFDKTEALKNTAPAWVEGILKSKAVKQENENTLNFALDFENTDFDHDVAAKYYGYTSWAELLDNMSEFNIDAQSVALLAQDDTGLEYVFAFAKIESADSLKYPAALTTELTHKLHIDLFINITQSDNIIIKYIPEGLVEYSEFEQHVANAEDVYAKKIDVYTKVESDNSFLTKTDAAATYTTKTETYNRTEIDDKAKGTIVINYDIDTKTPTQEVKQYNKKWLVDSNVLAGFADHINRLRGRNKLSNPNFNETKETGVYYVSHPTTENHAPCDNYGTLIVANGNNSRCAQMFISDTAPARFFYRNQLDSGVWLDWQESARQSNLTNYYTKTASDGLFARTVDLNNYYNKGEVDDNFKHKMIVIENSSELTKYGLDSLSTAQEGDYYLCFNSSRPDWIAQCPYFLRIIKVAVGTKKDGSQYRHCVGYGSSYQQRVGRYAPVSAFLIEDTGEYGQSGWLVQRADLKDNIRTLSNRDNFAFFGFNSPVTAQAGKYYIEADIIENKWYLPDITESGASYIDMIELDRTSDYIFIKAYALKSTSATGRNVYYGRYYGQITDNTKLKWFKVALTEV